MLKNYIRFQKVFAIIRSIHISVLILGDPNGMRMELVTMIKFDELEEKWIPNFKGGQGITRARMTSDGKVRIMTSVLEQGCSIGLHTHITSSEIVYVIQGIAKCIIDGHEEIVRAGECHYCPKGSSHMVINENEESLITFNVVPEQ